MHPEKDTNATIPQRPKLIFILCNILALALCSAINNGIYRAADCDYVFSPIAAPGVLLVLILTEQKGRKILFITLFILSLLSSISYLFQYRDMCGIVHAPVQGAAVALLSLVICEYCDPKRRFFYLMANSAIQMLLYRVTYVLQFDEDVLVLFGDYLQYFNIVLGAIGLYAVFKWPESPYWLASKGRFEESAQAFVAVRGGNSDSSEELRALIDPRPRPDSIKMLYVLILIAVPIVCLTIPSFDALALYHVFQYTLISSESLTSIEVYWLFVALKCIAAIASVVSVLITVKLPRKVLFLSCAFLFLASFRVVEKMIVSTEKRLKVSAVIFDTVVDFGPRTVAIPLIVELIPQQYSIITTAIISVMHIIIEWFIYYFDIHFTLFIFFYLVSAIVCFVLMPAAKEKTLLQIEQSYSPEKKEAPQPNQIHVYT